MHVSVKAVILLKMYQNFTKQIKELNFNTNNAVRSVVLVTISRNSGKKKKILLIVKKINMMFPLRIIQHIIVCNTLSLE